MAEKRVKFPYDYEILDREKNQKLLEFLKGQQDEFVHIGPKKFFISGGFMAEAENIYNLPLRSDDTFVVTFPRSGTTMTMEMVWLLCNNLDYQKAQLLSLNERFPFLELASVIRTKGMPSEEHKEVLMKGFAPLSVQQVEELPSPRFIKTHLPMSLLPPSLLDNTKVVYIARDPRDVAVSFFHQNKWLNMISADADFKTYWEYFISDRIYWTPCIPHILEAWDKRNHPNMLFLFYEEITKDMPGTLRRVAKFLGKTYTDEQFDGLVRHLDINNFKKNKSVNLENFKEQGLLSSDGDFIRKGKSGDWRSYFDEEMTAQAEEWIAENLRDTDFRFRSC